MAWILLLLIALAIFFIVFKKRSTNSKPNESFQYRKVNALFTPAEVSFMGVLSKVIGDKAKVLGKVRVADVISPNKGMSRSDWQKAFNKISSKHFDFIICDKNKLSVICAIELNDSSHNSKSRKERDILLTEVCKSAGVPLLISTARSTYKLDDIKNLIAPYLFSPSELTTQTPRETTGNKVCPKCLAPMVKRTAFKGKNAGKKFWGCSAYPSCKHIETSLSTMEERR